MMEHAHEFWERVLADIDDQGFFDREDAQAPDGSPANSLAPVPCASGGPDSGTSLARVQWPRAPMLYAHAEEWMTDVDAAGPTTDGLRLCRELFGPDFDRVVVLSLLPVALSLLLPLAVVLLLALAG